MEPLLNLKEVAAILGVSERTVKRLTAKGLPSVRVGRAVRFVQADVFRWVEARKE